MLDRTVFSLCFVFFNHFLVSIRDHSKTLVRFILLQSKLFLGLGLYLIQLFLYERHFLFAYRFMVSLENSI
jgi:hypothetical protein